MKNVGGCCNNRGWAFRFITACCLAAALAGDVNPVLADQRPPGCDVNDGMTMTIQQSVPIAAIGNSISYTIRFDNTGVGNRDDSGENAQLG